MQILAITDIPRMTSFFEGLGQKYPDLIVANEIHRGIDELESRKPEVVIIQNHLAGLSADILHKHLKSRLGKRKVRFGLISNSSTLDVDTSSQFEAILDPALSDEQLEQIFLGLFNHQSHPNRREASLQQPVIPEPSALALHEPLLPDLLPQQLQPALDHPTTQQQPPSTPVDTEPTEQDEQPSGPISYDLPRRPGISIISDFSKQLDTRSDELPLDPPRFSHREHELSIRDLHHEPHLITDVELPIPWYRRTGIILATVTLLAAVSISLYQHRSVSTVAEKNVATAETKAVPIAKPALIVPPVPPAAVVAPAAPVEPEIKQPLPSHGNGRFRKLPAFIPQEGLDQGYSKANPGWENYRGQTNEYRVFREKDGAIKAIQVIDRSGSGIQESFYTSILKELAGTTAMRPTASEIKEGYEIRRGVLAGLQLVQYRDAQGGRMHGFVITWP